MCHSGVPELFSVWENEGWYDPDRIISTLFLKKASKKSVEKKR